MPDENKSSSMPASRHLAFYGEGQRFEVELKMVFFVEAASKKHADASADIKRAEIWRELEDVMLPVLRKHGMR